MNKNISNIRKIISTILIISIIIILIMVIKNTQLLQRVTQGNKPEIEETKIEYEIIPNEENNLEIFLKIENKERNRKNNSIRWNDVKCKK